MLTNGSFILVLLTFFLLAAFSEAPRARYSCRGEVKMLRKLVRRLTKKVEYYQAENAKDTKIDRGITIGMGIGLFGLGLLIPIIHRAYRKRQKKKEKRKKAEDSTLSTRKNNRQMSGVAANHDLGRKKPASKSAASRVRYVKPEIHILHEERSYPSTSNETKDSLLDISTTELTDSTERRANSDGKLRKEYTSLGLTIRKKVEAENTKPGSKESLAQTVSQDNSYCVLSCPTLSRQTEEETCAVRKTKDSDTLTTLFLREGVSFTSTKIDGASEDGNTYVVSVQSDYHLAMIRKFVLPGQQTELASYSNLYINGTFETNTFHMITTSFKHPYIKHRCSRLSTACTAGNSSCNPAAAVIAGPTLLMTGKSQAEYVQAVQLLTAAVQHFCQQHSPKDTKNDPWSWTPVVVTDNEPGIRQALRYLLPNSTFLLCADHSRKCTRMHLEKTYRGYQNERHIAETLHDIYGSELGNDRYAGLIDCDTVKDFDEQLRKLVDTWERKLPGFYKWFVTYQKSDLCNCAIRAARKPAGMENVLPQNILLETVNSATKKTFPTADRRMVTLESIIITLQDRNQNEMRDIAELLVGRGEFEALRGAPLPQPSMDILSDDIKRGDAYKILFGFIPYPDPLQHLIELNKFGATSRNREIGVLRAIQPAEPGGGKTGPGTKRWDDQKRTAGASNREDKSEPKRQRIEPTPPASVIEPMHSASVIRQRSQSS